MAASKRCEQAKKALEHLIDLGWSQKEIATRLNANQSTICRIRNDASWAISDRLAREIETLATKARKESLQRLLPTVTPFAYTSGRHGPGVKMDNAAIEKAMRQALVDAVAHPKKSCQLPPGISAVVAKLGDSPEGVYVILLQKFEGADRSALCRELRHIADQMESQDDTARTERRKDDTISEGRAF
jgi:hypothetical protein